MTSPFPFVPRTLANARRKKGQNEPSLSTASTLALNATSHHLTPTATTSGNSGPSVKPKKYSNDDFTSLVSLALSDYALWTDPDLRRSIDWNSDESSKQEGGGFFPLSHLLKHSNVLSALNFEQLQIPIAKALRSDSKSLLEVRLLVSEPSSSTWSRKGDTALDIGAYEVRRRDWDVVSTRASKSYSKQEWDNRTVYVENIPVSHRTTPTMLQFINALLSERSSSNSTSTRVQGIVLPPHHQDKPEDKPTCKGFALIVLEEELDVDFLNNRWRWERQRDTDTESGEQNDDKSVEIEEATKFGFRTLLKSRWDKLKDEYLSYREQLVAEINAHQDAELPFPVSMPVQVPPISTTMIVEDPVPAPAESTKLNHSSPYPFDSLVFVRNIHPETNKTTLRKFFAFAFGSPLANNELKSDGIDYVDYNKGMDSCHLRLATPKHAQTLIEHFRTNPTMHARGLDEAGVPSDGTFPPILIELLTGKREQLYWEKVPEKVRRQAVGKALVAMQETSSSHVEQSKNVDLEEQGDRKRKRRKH